MTLRETMMAIEAVVWRREQERRGHAWLAWHVAALSRAKTLPPLARLSKPPAAKRLEGDDLEKRRREFEEMSEKFKAAHHRQGSTSQGGPGGD